MFPGYGKRPVAAFALAMDPAYLIHFPQPDGSRISVKTDGRVWYVTTGSWPVAGDLAGFVAARTKPK